MTLIHTTKNIDDAFVTAKSGAWLHKTDHLVYQDDFETFKVYETNYQTGDKPEKGVFLGGFRGDGFRI